MHWQYIVLTCMLVQGVSVQNDKFKIMIMVGLSSMSNIHGG